MHVEVMRAGCYVRVVTILPPRAQAALPSEPRVHLNNDPWSELTRIRSDLCFGNRSRISPELTVARMTGERRGKESWEL